MNDKNLNKKLTEKCLEDIVIKMAKIQNNKKAKESFASLKSAFITLSKKDSNYNIQEN